MNAKINISETLGTALAAYQAGNLSKAEQLYRGILATNPKHFDALNLLSVIHAQNGHFPEAARLIGEALKIRPEDDQALTNLGSVLLTLKRPEDALACFDRLLAIRPDHAEAHDNRGNALQDLNRLDEALESYDKALAIRPDYAEPHNNRGNVLRKLRRYKDSLESFDRALAIQPDTASFLFNRGISLEAQNHFDEALASYDKALTVRPDYAEALNNRGNVLRNLRRYKDSLESFDRALAIQPNTVDFLFNRGNALQELNRLDEALESYDKALAIHPDYAVAHNNRGNVLRSLRRYKDSLESFDRALAIQPHNARFLFNRGNVFMTLKYVDEAVEDFERLIEIDPNDSDARGRLYHAKRHACDWRNYEEETSLIMAELRAGRGCGEPWHLFSLSDSPCEQLRYAQTWQRERYPASDSPLWQGERYRHDRIRLAYVSADFHEHPMAWLMAGLFEQHDRSKFETIAISIGSDRPSPTRDRLVNAFEHFIDVRQQSPRETAHLLRDMEVDIAIDRKGYTQGSRTEIFAFRPAPIQVNYLAYPGSMGADYIDYIIADRFVIPEDDRQHYTEKVVYLPDTYQANDSKRVIAAQTPERGDVGLPEKGFVFSCFNNNYKITPQIFGIWMSLLVEIEGSALWVLESNAAAMRNMRQEAAKRGVTPERLVFAPNVKHSQHLARHRLADLFLDTLPFNGHTTASDALWAGLPVVTCTGNTFAGRVATSLLNAVGLPELVTSKLDAYENLAHALATNPAMLSDIKAKLQQNRTTHPLFDTDRYRRHLEQAYITMWERYQGKESPEGFSVPALVEPPHPRASR